MSRKKDWKDCKRVYVSTYEITRCYGGPEEGGWYYDHYECLDCKPTTPEKALKIMYNQAKAWGYDYSIESILPPVLSFSLGGSTYLIAIETVAREHETKYRPRYS